VATAAGVDPVDGSVVVVRGVEAAVGPKSELGQSDPEAGRKDRGLVRQLRLQNAAGGRLPKVDRAGRVELDAIGPLAFVDELGMTAHDLPDLSIEFSATGRDEDSAVTRDDGWAARGRASSEFRTA
jgi:hypothetical protein